MNKEVLNLIFTAFLLLVFTFAAIEALTFTQLAQFFPLYVSVIGSILSFIYLITLVYTYQKNRKSKSDDGYLPFWKPLQYILWVIGYLGVLYIAGFLIATSLFLFSFLIFESKVPVLKTSVSVAVLLGGISLISSALNIYWPTNLLGL